MDQQQTTQLGYDEIVDTIVDGITTAERIYDAFKDGVQITDAFVLLQVAPDVQDVAASYKQAYAELKDLTPDESEMAVNEIGAKLNLPATGVRGKIWAGLRLIAKAHRIVDESVDLVEDVKHWGESLRQAA